MKTNIRYKVLYLLGIFFLVIAGFGACSDITERHKDYLDQGEIIYVGKLDSISAYGGLNRVVLVGKNTYLRTAVEVVVRWVDIEGESNQKSFDLQSVIVGDETHLEIDGLDEGDYQFFVQTLDSDGNKSLWVECNGYAYGEKYMLTQPKIVVIDIFVDDNGDAELTMSKSQQAVKYELFYKDVNGVEKSIVMEKEEGEDEDNELPTTVKLPQWEDRNNSELRTVTYVLPVDKSGIDILRLPDNVQHAVQYISSYQVDKSKISVMELTAHDDEGTAHGAAGAYAVFDGDNRVEAWGENISAPGHMSFDLGKQSVLTAASIIGRHGYPGWDVVKFEIWGRESIEDGPDGPTGYYIQAESFDPGFEAEAVTRGWAKVGDGWFTYDRPRRNPQESQCELTNVDHSFKPRYIILRIMSVLTPDVAPVPDDEYFGEEGGFYYGDGVNNNNRAFCIGEMSLTAIGTTYRIE